MPIKAARSKGALALFGEKYGEEECGLSQWEETILSSFVAVAMLIGQATSVCSRL